MVTIRNAIGKIVSLLIILLLITTSLVAAQVKIMPIGDSILFGECSESTGGCRQFLLNALPNIVLVGSQSDAISSHESHPGWSTSDFLATWFGSQTYLGHYLEVSNPDIVLLHIGTNDISNESNASVIYSRLQQMLTIIHNFNPAIKIILAEITKRFDLNDFPNPTTEERAKYIETGTYDSLIQNSGESYIVDMYDSVSHFCTDDIELYPNAHPSTEGYQQMANVWFAALQNILPLLRLKVLLEGPYLGGGMMTTDLRHLELLPQTSPYQDYHNKSQYLNGSNYVVVPYTIPTNITDLIQIEIRGNDGTTVIEKKSCFLRDDGVVLDPDGASENISLGIDPGNYYVVVKHRNHLAVMSKVTVSLTGLTSYDFTTSQAQAYGTDQMADLGDGSFGMIAGDGNGNGQIQNNDSEDIWKPDNGSSGYKNSDYNLNGQVQNNDNEDFWKLNNGKGTQVPSYYNNQVVSSFLHKK